MNLRVPFLFTVGGGDDKKADVGPGNANFQFVSTCFIVDV